MCTGNRLSVLLYSDFKKILPRAHLNRLSHRTVVAVVFIFERSPRRLTGYWGCIKVQTKKITDTLDMQSRLYLHDTQMTSPRAHVNRPANERFLCWLYSYFARHRPSANDCALVLRAWPVPDMFAQSWMNTSMPLVSQHENYILHIYTNILNRHWHYIPILRDACGYPTPKQSRKTSNALWRNGR